jgi:3-hydroxyacyl-CoA dehydrogenase
MGNGIAQVAARAGYEVVVQDLKDEFLQRGLSAIDKSLQRDVDKERLSADEKLTITSRITTTSTPLACRCTLSESLATCRHPAATHHFASLHQTRV